jgi:hydroxypyruvate isomerase
VLRWSANLSLLFKEVPFLERFQSASAAGFGAVEFLWPAGVDLEALVDTKEAAGVDVALFNIDAGDIAKGERGFPNLPTHKRWWRERTELALDLAERLGAPRLNALAGNESSEFTKEQMRDCLLENLAWAIPKAQAAGVTLLLEPLNRFENPPYMLRSIDDTVSILTRLNSPQVKLQFDIYHTQRNEGNLVRLLQMHADRIGHIQIADSPERHQPGTGEINWRYVLGQLEACEYHGYVGLEYNPHPTTLDSLAWLPAAGRRACTAQDLTL